MRPQSNLGCGDWALCWWSDGVEAEGEREGMTFVEV
jgi:hypothetical protein